MSVVTFSALLSALTCATAIPLGDFYPFGFAVSDTVIPANDDGSSPTVFLTEPFPFFDEEHSTLFVNNNGDISFTASVPQFTPEPFPLSGDLALIAPYWADVDTTGTGTVWYRESTDAELLARARTMIQSAFTSQDNFIPSHIFVATWDHVGYYVSHTDKTNTFQCVMATNGVSAFVIFLYADGEIQWTTGDASGGMNGVGGTQAHVGFNAGDGIRFATVPNSQTPEIINISSTSNVGVPGVWIFRVDQEDIAPGGCSSEPNATLTLVPRLGNMLGGTPVRVAGLCLQPTDEITCSFDGVEVLGVFMNEMIALCISPQLTSTGRILFQMIVYANSGDLKFQGEDIFFSIPPDRGHAVDYNIPDLLFEPGVSFTVTWSPEFIVPFEDPSTYTVDISVYEYDATSSTWEKLEKLATGVPNTGERDVTIAADANLNTDTDVCQIAIQVAVSRPSTVTESDSNTMEKRLAILPAVARIALWGGIAYLSYLTLSHVFRNRCEEWCNSQPPNIGQEIQDRLRMFPCPPTMERANEDPRFKEDRLSSRIYVTFFDNLWRNFFHEGTASCFRQTTFTSANEGSGQQCCYDHNGLLCTDVGSGGTVDLVAPRDEESIRRHFDEDVKPYLYCCKGRFSNCDAYYRKRPSNDGTGYRLQVPAFTFGDPHIVTLDGLQYTFNGKGEFTLIETIDGSFTVQGRMIEAAGATGSLVQATTFSALVCKQNTSDTVQFELSRRGIDVLVNGERVVFDDLPEQDYNNVIVTDQGNNTASALFSNGVRVTAKEESGIISVLRLSIPSDFQGTTRGLMGTFNGDTSDDLFPKFSTEHIPTNSSLQVIHNQFGITWIIDTAAESLFTYKAGESWENFFSPSFTPTYEPIFSSADLEVEANALCGGDQFCLFDVAATGRSDIGLSTLEGTQNFDLIVQLSFPIFCDPPCENGACVANDTCNCAAGFEGITCNKTVYSDCDINLCENGAICLKHVATYICECSLGFTGSLCETAVDDSENSIPVIVGATVGGIVLLLVIVTVACIVVARRHKSLQQREAPTQMEMKECEAYGISSFSMDERSSASASHQHKIKMPASQQQKEDKIPASGNAISSAHVTCDADEVYEEVSDTGGTNGSKEQPKMYMNPYQAIESQKKNASMNQSR